MTECIQSCSQGKGPGSGIIRICIREKCNSVLEEQKYQEQKQQSELEIQRLQNQLNKYQYERPTSSCPTNSREMTMAEKSKSNTPGANCTCFDGYEPDVEINKCTLIPEKIDYNPPPCPKYSRGTTAAEKAQSGKRCACLKGYEPDLETNTCNKSEKKVDNYEPPTYEYEPSPSYKTKKPNNPVRHSKLPSDVPSDAWYREPLGTFVEKGLIDPSMQFKPATDATRADFITLVINFLDGPRPTGEKEVLFDDVPPSSTYFLHFQDAAFRGVIKGYDNCVIFHTSPCKANPLSSINRAEAAAIINRAFYFEPVEDSPLFNDNPIDAWFNIVISKAASHCILQGYKGDVRPGESMNRAEMVIMIDRASQNLQYPSC